MSILGYNHRQGFTLVEIMIVIAMIGVLALAVFYMGGPYLNRSRDVARFGDLQQYARVLDLYYKDKDTIPSNTHPENSLVSSYCADEVFFEWENGDTPDEQHAELRSLIGSKPLVDPIKHSSPIVPCSRIGSYLYSSIKTPDGKIFSLLGTRMSIAANGNYMTGSDIRPDGQVDLANLQKMQNTYKGTISDTTEGNTYYFVATQY